jgi:acetylornithine deacetylase/succinyl-diaminopimelate desuccinylase-like protein
MRPDPSAALDYSRTHASRFVEELKEFIRYPTVSAQPKHAEDIRQCASWLAGHLRRMGLEHVEIVPTRRHPLVYGASRRSPDKLTVLIYGHYDVQPVDPLREWRSPPFEPAIRGDNLFGRGASDDKGQLFVHIKAVECYFNTIGELPVNIQLLIDGEEEIGSPNLTPFLKQNATRLASDVAALSDTSIRGPRQAAITYGTRGQLSLELTVRVGQNDLHSGTFGGAVQNPLLVLCEIIAKLHDSARRVAIPGFYAKVRKPSLAEQSHLAQVGPSDAQFLLQSGQTVGWGETGFSSFERATLRPALTFNGLTGGYQGPGNKGVIPASATAKLSFRLVPNQDPVEIERLFRRHVTRIAPNGVRIAVRTYSAAKPFVMAPTHDAVHAAAFAYRKGFGVAPILIRSGGTIPAINALRETIGAPVVLMGFGLPDDRMHAPNEKFHLPNFLNGIATSIWFLAALASGSNQASRRRKRTRQLPVAAV